MGSIALLACLHGLFLASPPPDTPPPPDSQTVSAGRSLDLAVAEIDACCAGLLEEADWDAQRRWAQSLFRLAVLSDGRPDWSTLGRRQRLAAQALRLDPAYVAALAVHPRSWLETYWDHLPRAAPAVAAVDSLAGMAGAVLALAVFEQEIEAAIDERNQQVREADREFQARAGETMAERARIRKVLDALTAGKRAVDLDTLFGPRRAELTAEIEQKEVRARELRKESFAFQAEWRGKIQGSEEGALELYRGLGQYQAKVKAYESQIQELKREIESLRRERERYRAGPAREDLDRLERPPATRPVL